MNKKVIFFTIFLLIFVLNIFLYFSREESKKKSAIKTNKLFEIEIEKNAKNSQMKVKNDIEHLNKNFNFLIPNFSVLFFDLPENLVEQVNEISNIFFAPRFGFQKISKDFLEKINDMNKNNIYFRIFIKNGYSDLGAITFNNNDELKSENVNKIFAEQEKQISDLIFSNEELKPIIINPNYFNEENKEIFGELKRLKNEYNIDFYILEEDLAFLDSNSDLIDLIINLKPLLINTNHLCNLESHLCFFHKSQSIDNILAKIKDLKNEIIDNKIQKKNILLGFSSDRKDILLEEFAKKIKEIIYSGSFKS